MKTYVKPNFLFVELRAEERLAGSGSGCVPSTGTCGYMDPISHKWVLYDVVYVGENG